MRTSVLVGLAGVALSASAFAQDKTLPGFRLDPSICKVAPASAYLAGPPKAEHTTRFGPAAIYDTIGVDPTYDFHLLDLFFWFGYLQGPIYADSASLVPGRHSALDPQLITELDLVIDVQDSTSSGARTFDVLVLFYDQADPASVAPTQAYSVPIDVGGFVSTISIGAGAWGFGWDLTGFPSGGIQLTDNGLHVEVGFYETGTGQTVTVAAGDSVAMLFNSTSTWATAGTSPALLNGDSESWFFFDSDLDGVITNSNRFRTSAYDWLADFCMAMWGDARCSADYNNDGFVDPGDYTDFINSFEAGGCP
jgi:hypothetical protein